MITNLIKMQFFTCTNTIAFSSFLILSDNQSMLFEQLKYTYKMWNDNVLLKSLVVCSN